MNMKKVFAGAAASVLAVSSLAATASAYEASLMYADGTWSLNTMNETAEFVSHTEDITADGTYTVYVDEFFMDDEAEDYTLGNGATVFCVDIEGLAGALNCGKDADGYAALETGADKMAFAKAAGLDITDVKVTTTDIEGDETEVAVDNSKIIFGDIEGNNKIRIEIYNEYGDTKDDSPINRDDIFSAQKVAVTFTVKGLGGEPGETPTESESAATEEPAATENTEAASESTTAATTTEASTTESANTTTSAADTTAATSAPASDSSSSGNGWIVWVIVCVVVVIIVVVVIVIKKKK